MLPDLDAPCSRHFRYRDLIECSDTWQLLAARGEPLDNIPRSRKTTVAMRALSVELLDRIVDAFGRVELTYGFASPALTRCINKGIAPSLDQHVGMELDRNGTLACVRGGLAVDFRVPGHDSRHIAQWVVKSVAFDRIYLYGPDRPLHVSIAPRSSRQVVEMKASPTGRRTPRRVPLDELMGERFGGG